MKRYPAYKDSGIEWIGEIPDKWEMRKISRTFNLIGGGTTPKSDNNEYFENGTISWINTGDLNDGCLNNSSKFINNKALEDYSTLKIYKKGTLIIALYGATIGKICLIDFEGCTNQACCALSDSPYITNRYAFYWFLASRCHIINLSRGSGQPNISQDIIRFLKLPSPPHNEQKKITNYLDHKTCLIDAIIEKKQKQIELLQEQRTGVINQAVTKGLNPTVKMENTWIEWLCEVPEHWEIKRLKNISKIRYGLGQPPKEQDGGLPLIRATNIKRGRVVENGMVYVNPDDVPYDRDPILRTDDIVVVRSGAYTADSAIIPEQYDGAIVGYDMVVKIYTAIPKLISYALLSSYVLENQLFLKRLRAAQPHLNAEELGETIILIPPDIEEQRGILIFIETKSYQIDRLISRTEKQIELLKEYRITLISEVVTGKIDVRDEVIP